MFARAALEACRYMNWQPDIIHAHDWHSAAAIRLHWAAKDRAALVFTIHNIAHQGLVRNTKWPLLGVYNAVGPLNLMEQAIYAADVVTTVSPTYSHEIRTAEYGFGLEQVLREIQRDCEPQSIEVYSNMALVATVGKGMIRSLGVAARLFGALYEAGVNVRMIDQGSSEMNIIVGIENDDLNAAVKAIYRAFA